MTATYCLRTDSPLGELLLLSDGEALTGLHLPGAATPPDAASGGGVPVLAEAAAQLREYFAGGRSAFDLPLAAAGTPFQRRVWAELGRIPFGTTISYAELAARVGDPRASRAVGSANGRNPVAIVVPCHRVVASGGGLGGYGGGLAAKEFLLRLEGGRGTGRGRPAKTGTLLEPGL